ncbi:endonuclease/exonuclease/phosphatase family protein [Desertivirga xinjiangensis]|uniref:endonuclease/exonuclease/phosphatase family protein n=1 Tax=Desertivirga xinjiangensis TaxID=539206 RepID=UPI00210ECE4E|nr:endonuclease/exonuclease/phosphatase family protein [Pedobacter xinjiangensis]
MTKKYTLFTGLLLILFTGLFAGNSKQNTQVKKDQTPKPSFKILSYNVYEGFRKDSIYIKAFQKWVKEKDPDVVAFQELNGFSKEKLIAMAKNAGYRYTVLQKRAGFPLALMSKYPVSNVRKVTEGMQHGLLYGKVLNYHLFITHLDPRAYEKRISEVDTLLKYLHLIPKNEKILLMGDFNNMSPLDKKDYDNPAKMKLVLNSEKNNLETRITRNGEIDYTAIQKLLDAGLYDSWRLFHQEYEKSAPTKIRNHNNYTRIDYIYINAALKNDCIAAELVKDDLTDVLSDHYPMLITLKNR